MKRRFILFSMPIFVRYQVFGIIVDEFSSVNMGFYVPTQSGKLEEDISDEMHMLSTLFREFNLFKDKELTKGYAAPSMSPGDVVQLYDEDTLQSSYYLCQSIGWRKLDQKEIYKQREILL